MWNRKNVMQHTPLREHLTIIFSKWLEIEKVHEACAKTSGGMLNKRNFSKISGTGFDIHSVLSAMCSKKIFKVMTKA